MTFPLRRAKLLLLGLVLAGPLSPTALAAPDEAPRDRGDEVVARCQGFQMTRRALGQALWWRLRSDLQEHGSAALTILRGLIEERVVAQEARRLGVTVTPQDVQRAWAALDADVRRKTNGARRLEDVIAQDFKTTPTQFREHLALQSLKERIASHPQHLGDTLPKEQNARINQTEVVITELWNRAALRYGVKTALSEAVEDLPRDVLVLVNGEPIGVNAYAESLLDRLSATDVHDVVVEQCKAILTREYALSVEAMEAVVAEERERWNVWRETATQEAMRGVSYEDYVRLKFRFDVDTLKQDRYARGIYGLRQSFREAVAEEDVRKEYESQKDGLFGEAILVTDVQIAFSTSNALLRTSARDRREALQMAQEILRKHHAGVPFEQIAREVNAKQDRTFRAVRLKIRKTPNEQIVYDRARTLSDGGVSMPFETLSEVHVVRREGTVPALSYEEAAEMVREGIASRQAHAWLQAAIEDPSRVQILWPPQPRPPR